MFYFHYCVSENPQCIEVSSPKDELRKTRPLDRSRSHQETLTKDEARKRMLSWRNTNIPLDKKSR